MNTILKEGPRRRLSLLLALVFTLALLPLAALPAYAAVEDFTLYFNATDGKLYKTETYDGGSEYDADPSWEGTKSGGGDFDTLTLTDFSFSTTEQKALVLPAGTTLVLKGDNVLSCGDATASIAVISTAGALTITGGGSLTVSAGESDADSVGIAATGKLTVSGGTTLTAQGHTKALDVVSAEIYTSAAVTANDEFDGSGDPVAPDAALYVAITPALLFNGGTATGSGKTAVDEDAILDGKEFNSGHVLGDGTDPEEFATVPTAITDNAVKLTGPEFFLPSDAAPVNYTVRLSVDAPQSAVYSLLVYDADGSEDTTDGKKYIYSINANNTDWSAFASETDAKEIDLRGDEIYFAAYDTGEYTITATLYDLDGDAAVPGFAASVTLTMTTTGMTGVAVPQLLYFIKLFEYTDDNSLPKAGDEMAFSVTKSNVAEGIYVETDDLLSVKLGTRFKGPPSGTVTFPAGITGTSANITVDSDDVAYYAIGGNSVRATSAGFEAYTQSAGFYANLDTCGGMLAIKSDGSVRYGCTGGKFKGTPVYLYESQVYTLTAIDHDVTLPTSFAVGDDVSSIAFTKAIGTFTDEDDNEITAELDSSKMDVKFLHKDGTTGDTCTDTNDMLRLSFGEGNVLYIRDVKIFPDPPSDSGSSVPSVGSKDAEYVSGSSDTVTVRLMSGGSKLNAVTYGNRTLREGTDYTVYGNAYTFTDSFLDSLEDGAHKIVFEMSSGADVPFTINVSGAGSFDCDGGAHCPSHPLKDISTDKWYHEAVDYVVRNGIMEGTGPAKFEPDMPLTRAMMAQMFYNLENASGGGSGSFDDVASDGWYYNAVTWAAERGIVAGYGDGSFAPDKSVTREEMAVMLNNYCEYKGISLDGLRTGGFSDAGAVSVWAEDAVTALYQAGILNGRGGNFFTPGGTATRAEIAQMFMNFMEA